MDLDVLLAHEDNGQALAQLLALTVPLPKLVLQYLRCFKPAKNRLSHSRAVALLSELLPDMQRGVMTRAGREWAAPVAAWKAGIERVLELRDAGKLTLPLKSHGYLLEIMVGLADKAEAQAERDTESARRHRVVTGAVAEGAVSVGEALGTAPAPALPPLAAPVATGPSRYAQKVKAQAEAQKAARAGLQSTDEDAPQ